MPSLVRTDHDGFARDVSRSRLRHRKDSDDLIAVL